MALSAKRPSKGEETRQKIMQDVTEAGEKKRRLNADFEESLYKRMKFKSVDEGRSIAEITRALWIEYLDK